MRIDIRRAATVVSAAALALTAAGCDRSETAATASAAGGPTGTPAATGVPAPAGQAWTDTTAVTPENGFRIGNPEAKVKLIEYASLTCPHCAAFSAEATKPMMDLIRAGNVSWEYRTFLLNGIDVPVSLLARCQGAGPFFAMIEQIYSGQQGWIAKFQQLGPDQEKAIQALPPAQQPLGVAKAGQLIGFFGARGLPEGKAQACLTDQAEMTKLEALQRIGTDRDGVTGTPSFLINGQPVKNVASWDLLKPEIQKALAG